LRYKDELKANLLAIYHLGDQDECSWKHLGHAFASMVTTGDWVNAMDYDNPFGGDFTDTEFEQLASLWANVEFICSEVDKDVLTEVAIELSQTDQRLMMLDRYLDEYEREYQNDNES